MKRLLVICLLLLSGLAIAETGTDAEMRLTVKPILCITDRRTPSCNMSFLVMWESGTSGYYCLFSDFDEAPVRCWSRERTGQLNDDRTVRQNFSYWMAGDDADLRLAQVEIEVLRMDTDDRRRKRRTRHVWDIN